MKYPSMPTLKSNLIASAVLSASLGLPATAVAQNGVIESLKEGDVIANFRLRHEGVDDSSNKDASALTLRSVIGYETPTLNGFKLLAEYEDVRALGDDYAPEKNGYALVADPENSEINRAQLSYSQDAFKAIIGRQKIILDNARFVGNVGWRQNEQTFDAVKIDYTVDAVEVQYAYVDQVNSILRKFDADVSNHLLNVSYTGLEQGKLTGFAYLLKDDDSKAKNDTYGVRFAGKQALDNLNLIYSASYATQSTDSFDASYLAIEGGLKVAGITLAAGNETLGSDDGKYGFQTPLATKHAFNGWADKFLGTPKDGLSDTYVKAVTKVAGIKLLAMYHSYKADEGNTTYGTETNLLAAKKINKNFSLGIKAAAYKADDFNKDTDKLWIWGQASF